MLDKEVKTLEKNLPELVKTDLGRFVLIKDEQSLERLRHCKTH